MLLRALSVAVVVTCACSAAPVDEVEPTCELVVSPASVELVSDGEAVTAPITLTNAGDATCRIELAVEQEGQWLVLEPTQPLAFPTTLAPAASLAVTIMGDPRLSGPRAELAGAVVLAYTTDGTPEAPRVARVPARMQLDCANDAFEPNDAPAEATPIALTRSYAARVCREEVDMFVVRDVAEPVVAVFRVAYEQPPGEAASYLRASLSANGESVSQGTYVVEQGTMTINELHWGLYPGTEYVLAVDGSEHATKRYVLSTTVSPNPCAADPYEPDDVAADATPVAAGDPPSVHTLCPGDVDYLQLALAQPATVSVALAWLEGGHGDFTVLSMAAPGTIYPSQRDAGGESIPSVPLAAGTYTIAVRDTAVVPRRYSLAVVAR